MVSAVRRLLDELSWEGNPRKYRDGGLGLENVLTAEVFQALDFLPRQAFLARVLAGASGAPLKNPQSDIEQAMVDILPGDLAHPDLGIRAQPDVVIDSPEVFIFVEAKRLRPSSFQPDQLAKELILTAEHARGRRFAPIGARYPTANTGERPRPSRHPGRCATRPSVSYRV